MWGVLGRVWVVSAWQSVMPFSSFVGGAAQQQEFDACCYYVLGRFAAALLLLGPRRHRNIPALFHRTWRSRSPRLWSRACERLGQQVGVVVTLRDGEASDRSAARVRAGGNKMEQASRAWHGRCWQGGGLSMGA